MIKNLIRKTLLPKIYKFYLSFNLKPEKLILKSEDKCLLIAPHADDESIGAGGLLALYGRQFDAICLTNGYKGLKKLPKEQAIEVRKNEFVSAVSIANVNSYRILNIDDKSVISSQKEFSEIDIDDYDYIFIPNIIDQHTDHKAVSLNLLKLIKEKQHKPTIKVVFYEVWSALALPNAYVDISTVVDKKASMIESHKSQVAEKDYTKRILGLNCYRGMTLSSAEYVEAFFVMNKDLFFKVVKSCL